MAEGDKIDRQKLEVFTELLASCQTQLIAYAFALVQNMADAEDICQRASLVLWQKFEQYDPDTEFRVWAIKVAQYEAYNFIRKRRRDRIFFSDETLQSIVDLENSDLVNSGAIFGDRESRWAALKKCIDKLPEHRQALIRLYYGGAKTVSQVATELGRTEGAVRSALCRVRKVLHDCVEGFMSEEPT